MYSRINLSLFTILLILTFSFCSTNESVNSSNQKSESVKKIRKCWIDNEYLIHLNNKFPEKRDQRTDISNFLLNELESITMNEFSDDYIYEIKVDEKGYYFITYDTISYRISILNTDSILLNNNLYVSDESWETWGKKFIDKIRGDVFRKKYENRYKDKLHLSDSTTIWYHSQFHTFLIKDGSSCQNNYTLEFNKDSVYIYNFINSCEILPRQEIIKSLLSKFPQ